MEKVQNGLKITNFYAQQNSAEKNQRILKLLLFNQPKMAIRIVSLWLKFVMLRFIIRFC